MVAKSQFAASLKNEDVKKLLHPFRRNLEIAIYGSENYFNLGSLIRTTHNFLLQKVYGIETKYYKKATMGAKKYEEIDLCTISEFLEKNKDRNIVAMERRPGLKSESLLTFVWPENPTIVLGSEKFGVPDEILEVAHSVVEIPCYGVLNDFNVATAGAIAVYDWTSKNHRG